jgi:hypothetical protein
LANENKNYYPNIDKTKNNVNNEETLSQYQDKYFIKDVRETQGENEFETLAGNKQVKEHIPLKKKKLLLYLNRKQIFKMFMGIKIKMILCNQG